MDLTLGAALFAGLISFLSPCVLPLVPGYLSYMSGLSTQAEGGRTFPVWAVALAFVSMLNSDPPVPCRPWADRAAQSSDRLWGHRLVEL